MLDSNKLSKILKSVTAVLLVLVLSGSSAIAGISVTSGNGIVMTGADGIDMTSVNGVVLTGADGVLNCTANGVVMTGANGIVMTGADGFPYPDSIRMISADSVNVNQANGIVMTGADGIVMTGADGTQYQADSVTVTLPNGIVMTGADGIVMTGVDGVQQVGSNGLVVTGADGIVMTGADGIVMTGADSLRAIDPNGVTFSISPNGVSFTGVTGIVISSAAGIAVTGANGIVMTGADGLLPSAGNSVDTGLQSVDPELAVQLNQVTDDSGINAAVVYHQLPTDSDLADLQRIGIAGGTRFHVLPVVIISATRDQIIAISKLADVRSIYGTRTLTLTTEPEVRGITGVDRAWQDAEITQENHNLPVSGRNVTVAVLDTGVDGTHADLAGRMAANIKLADTQSAGIGFNYPIDSPSLPDTDQAYGHGTFVAGIVAGSGNRSNGRYTGVAPGARVVGLSAGDLSLLYVLDGFDYLLANRSALGVRVVNCSFSADTVFDTNDPVNVATKMLTDAGVNVVFSAGNSGPGLHTLNPYAVAPWVVSVGATDTQGRLQSFSSRGDFASGFFRPTLVAPGLSVVSLRGSGITNVTGVEGIAGSDLQRLSALELPFYTTASGTSFSAPQVAGTIALMLEANPDLNPAKIREILERTATPLPPYYSHEVGAGMLNVHAAVLQAAFMARKIGTWRGTLDRGQVQFLNDPQVTFSGTVQPGTNSDSVVQMPDNALLASVEIAWGPLWTTNDLGLYFYDGAGTLQAQSNVLNLPGLNGRRESAALNTPAAGSWRVNVRNTLPLGTSQQFFGVLEVGRANYAQMTDLNSLSSSLRADIYQSIRSFTMWPIGSRFRPTLAVSRSDLATALVLGGRVPQYLPGTSHYTDVHDAMTMLFVESAQASPTGALFVDVSQGGQFRPNDNVNRLAAAIALVRAAGLRSQAEAQAGTVLPYSDGLSIPSQYRGYVSVAVSQGFLQAGSAFLPQNSLTRADLAHAVAVIENRATQ